MAKRSNGKRGNDDLSTLVAKHVDDLVSALRDQLRQQVAQDIQRYFAGGGASAMTRTRGGGRGRGKPKRILPCIAPGCKSPSKGPRFRYLCDKHREAPKKEVLAWQAAQKSARKAQKSA